MITTELRKNLLVLLKNKERNFLIVGQLFSALLSIVLGKLTAIYIVPEKFGLFNLQLVAYTFFFSLFISPFLQFMKTFTATKLSVMGHQHVFRLLAILLLFSFVSLTIFFLLKFHVSAMLLILILLTLITNVGYNLVTDYFNVKAILSKFTWSTLFKSIFSLLVLIVGTKLILTQENGEVILWLVQIAGYFFGMIFFIRSYKIVWNSDLKEPFIDFLKDFRKFSWPLMILAFWTWINSYFDRYVIEYFMQLKDVGIYNANLGLGSKIFLMISPIFLALLTPIAFNMELTIVEKKKLLNKYAVIYLLMAVFILFFLYFTYEWIGELLLSDLYREGFYIIFWSALAYFAVTLTSMYELLFFAEGKTKVILFSNVISAMVNVVLIFLLIPKFGLHGAIAGLVLASLLRIAYIKFIFHNYSN